MKGSAAEAAAAKHHQQSVACANVLLLGNCLDDFGDEIQYATAFVSTAYFTDVSKAKHKARQHSVRYKEQ